MSAPTPARTDGYWLTTENAAAYLDYPNDKKGLKAFSEWARRKRIPTAHRGRRLLYARVDLDHAIGAGHRRGNVHSEKRAEAMAS